MPEIIPSSFRFFRQRDEFGATLTVTNGGLIFYEPFDYPNIGGPLARIHRRIGLMAAPCRTTSTSAPAVSGIRPGATGR